MVDATDGAGELVVIDDLGSLENQFLPRAIVKLAGFKVSSQSRASITGSWATSSGLRSVTWISWTPLTGGLIRSSGARGSNTSGVSTVFFDGAATQV
jgi:hypothetical protein